MNSEIINLPKSKKARFGNTAAKLYIALINERNVCFVNSTIQVIHQLPLWAKYMQYSYNIAMHEIHDITCSSETKLLSNLRNIIGG